MTERKTSYVKCPRCGSEAYKVHNPKEIEEKYKGNDALIVRLKRQYICSNKECSYVWELSMIELLNAFAEMRIKEGKTGKEISDELNKAKKDAEKKERMKV